MLAQTIQISFSSYAADTIRIHTGETGREIAFIPDMDISGEYSADFIVIKPDDTFTIAAATITDGKINVEIPEQAGAVAGAGHYILKIYDSGEVCIYSASGGFMVDDHLLTDGIIESVAEVYGYQFPQDFALKSETATLNDNVTATNSTWSSRKIQDELDAFDPGTDLIDDEATGTDTTWSSSKISEEIAAASPDLIDDNEVLYDKTWSSEKISYELGNVQPFHVYTSTEQPVGRWIDGTTVYEMTIEATNISYGNPVQLTIPTDVNIKEITGIGRIFLSNRFYYMPIGCVSAAAITTWTGIKIDAEPKYSRLTVNLNAPSGSTQTYVQITIRYTKPLS